MKVNGLWVILCIVFILSRHFIVSATNVNVSVMVVDHVSSTPPEPPSGGGGGSSAPEKSFYQKESIPIARKPTSEQTVRLVDFSGDGKINIVDMSIMLFYYGTSGTKAARYDFNKDGHIDIKDLSIMLYYWTKTGKQ